MTIKEVEKKVGITSANIRFYEKEGPLAPERNASNNYREYSEEDAVCLQKIKMLRMLGIGISDIKKAIDGDAELGEILETRLAQIKEEEEHLEELEKICRDIVKKEMSFATLDSHLIDDRKEIWQERLAYYLTKDITQEWVTPKKMNCTAGGMLLYFFVVNTAVAFLLGNYFAVSERPMLPIIICAGTAFWGIFATAWSVKMWVQIVVFQLLAFSLTPAFICILSGFRFVKDSPEMASVYEGNIMLLMSVYVLLLLGIYYIKETFFDKLRNGIITAVIYSVVATVVGGMLTGNYFFIGICMFVLTIYISIHWSEMNVEGAERYNKYYAVSSVMRMVNLPAQLHNGQYVGSEHGWGRG